MINVLITAKPSSRFPRKNLILAPYSIAWLNNEIAYMDEPVAVYTAGIRKELPWMLPPAWKHFEIDDESHPKVVQEAEKLISPAEDDVMVLVQLTQPVREPGMLYELIYRLREGMYPAATTAATMPTRGWRAVTGGRFNPDDHKAETVIDGQLYAWRPGYAFYSFDNTKPRTIVETHHRWGIIDIDYPEDIPPNMNSMFGDMLSRHMTRRTIALRLRGKKVLLVGSGIDLVGRKLGEAVDRGDWDLVVRCNHFQGDPEDVGHRTDIAVMRRYTGVQAFNSEAPEPAGFILPMNAEQDEITQSIERQAAQEVGHHVASCGVIAARWLLNRGAKVSAIGMGHRADGTWEAQKTYPDGRVDHTTIYDWDKEHAWWEKQKDIELL